MRKNETLIFNQCEIIKTDAIPSTMGAFLSIDDSNTIGGIGEMGNTGGEMDITFINNNFYSETLGKSDEGVTLRGTSPMNDNCIIGSVVLSKRSYGNNVSLLNK